MKKLFILLAVMIFHNVAEAQNSACDLPGKAMHWIADYCLHQAETDDFQEQRVQTCFEKHQGYKTQDTCENRRKYKMKLCQHMVNMGFYYGDTEMCFHDKEFIPATVRNGGI